jgi:glucose/arabinose dehydrogenase
MGHSVTVSPRAVALVATAIALAWAAPPAAAALHLSQVGTFSQPVYVTAPPGDPHRLFVVEQAGRIMEVLDGQKLATPFLDITHDVRCCGEQGLLSMAFAPDYATSGRFYVYYTAPAATGSTITVDEFKRATLDSADPSTRRNLFTVPHPTNSNHNGGQLQFGPDGLLYAGTGDGGSGNDPPNNAQNLGSRLGKLLRVDPLSGAAPDIYAYGLRNPFRFSFDRQTGDLVIADVGQDRWEEVDFSPAGTPAGRNYGWRCREGMHPTPGVTCTAPGAIDPVLEKDHNTTGFCAIIGGYVVRDASVGPLAGRYVYGDNCADELRSAALASPRTTDDSGTGLHVSGLTSFGEDSCGHVYAASGDGPVYRIEGDTFTPCPGTPPPDTTPPVVTIGARAKQRVLRQRGLRLDIGCGEACDAKATATTRIGGSARVYRLRAVTRQIAANGRVNVTLRASTATLKAIRLAFSHHRSVRAVLTVSASDAAANTAVAKRTVRVVP